MQAAQQQAAQQMEAAQQQGTEALASAQQQGEGAMAGAGKVPDMQAPPTSKAVVPEGQHGAAPDSDSEVDSEVFFVRKVVVEEPEHAAGPPATRKKSRVELMTEKRALSAACEDELSAKL